jgi:hypothetical protein
MNNEKNKSIAGYSGMQLSSQAAWVAEIRKIRFQDS